MKSILIFCIFFALAFAQTQTICVKYSAALKLNNNQLVTAVVLGVFANITNANSPLLTFFNGAIINYPGNLLINFLTPNTTYQNTLVLHLVQFFGNALGCSDGTIGAYAGATMTASHNFMKITAPQFAYFEQAVESVMGGYGVTATDLATVQSVLETLRTMICNQPGCVAASNSLVPLFAAIIFAFVFLSNL